MPRRLVMVSSRSASGQRMTIGTPARGGDEWYLLSDAKKHKNFEMTPRTLPNRFIHSCLISKHVGPFVIAQAATAALPIIRTDSNSWRKATDSEVAASPASRDHFSDIVEESDFRSLDEFWESGLNYRYKLTNQVLAPSSWLVVYGAGGGIPAAAFSKISSFGSEHPVIDQTLYWVVIGNENEALFLVGVINSDVLLERIADFIPQGDFGDRHLHTLPSMAVPQYDPSDEVHERVVTSTRALYSELHAYRNSSDTKIKQLFTNEISMTVRRRRLRKLIKQLASFDEYAASCRQLYDAVIPNN